MAFQWRRIAFPERRIVFIDRRAGSWRLRIAFVTLRSACRSPAC
jgi:hypothetical protein